MSSLLISVILLMLVSAAYTLVNGEHDSAGRSDAVGQYQGKDAALEAAESGYRYALSRLQLDPTWNGSTPGSSTPINIPGEMVVIEDNGNVIGILTDRFGRVSQFRIRFNFQNGGSTPYTNPAANHFVFNPFVSFNNLASAVPGTIYRGDQGTNYAVSTSNSQQFQLPGGTAHIFVEGWAGDPVNATSLSNPTPSSMRGVSKQVVESTIVRGAAGNSDSAVYAGSGINADASLQKMVVRGPNKKATARIRMNGDVAAQGTVYDSPQGKISISTGSAINGMNLGTAVAEPVDPTANKNLFLRTTWASALTAGTAVSPGSLAAGTYVFRNTGLEYFDQEYSSAAAIPAAGTGVTAVLPSSMSANNGNVTFTDVTTVASTANSAGVHFVVDYTSFPTNLRPHFKFNGANGASAVLRAPQGAITLQGDSRGSGSIVSNGTVTMQGASALEAKADDNVAIYARQDVMVTAIPPAVAADLLTNVSGDHQDDADHMDGYAHGSGGSHNGAPNNHFGPAKGDDVNLRGNIFAQGNVTVDLANGQLFVRGVLSAFGGDPDAGEAPGTREGKISFTNVKNAQFVFDPLYAPSAGSVSGSTALDRVSCNVYRR